MYVCVCVCVFCLSVCLSVCLKAMRFDILAPIATKLHTRTEDFPGTVLKLANVNQLDLLKGTYRKGRCS